VWPGQAPQARLHLAAHGLAVIALTTGQPLPREQARIAIRAAASELMASEATLRLMSISHEDALSVAVVSRGFRAGVDVVCTRKTPADRTELLQVARDYLGPAEAQQFAGLAPAALPHAFATAWAQWEARLKCHRLDLAEWSPELQQRVDACSVQRLDLAPPLVGALALLKDNIATGDAP
jgi:phosphopantetheinyl transferase